MKNKIHRVNTYIEGGSGGDIYRDNITIERIEMMVFCGLVHEIRDLRERQIDHIRDFIKGLSIAECKDIDSEYAGLKIEVRWLAKDEEIKGSKDKDGVIGFRTK